MNHELTVHALLDLTKTVAADIFEGLVYPWEALPKISEFTMKLGAALPKDEYIQTDDNIWIANSASVAESAYLHGPLIVWPEAEIRHCAFIRGSAIIGRGAVIGNSTELKNCIIFDKAQVPHYNYIGDSILGFQAHLGAGAITSNLKSDRSMVTVRREDEKLATELKKFGAIVGDHVEVGCNSVLNPGTVIGRNATVYPLSMVRGVVPSDSIYKKQGEVAEKVYE